MRVAGDVDFTSSQTFRCFLDGLLCGDSVDALIVSLEECKYIDSTVLAIFVEIHRANGSRFKLIVAEQTCVHRILSVTGLNRALNVFSSLSEALGEPPQCPVSAVSGQISTQHALARLS